VTIASLLDLSQNDLPYSRHRLPVLIGGAITPHSLE
jgi:hypothetical protein